MDGPSQKAWCDTETLLLQNFCKRDCELFEQILQAFRIGTMIGSQKYW